MALSLAACVTERFTEPTTVQIVVQAVLDPSSQVQEVLVQEANTGQPFAARCVVDAQVEVITSDGVSMHGVQQPAPCGPYRVALDDYGVRLRPGATYTLRVATRDGHEISGTTTIPDGRPVDPSSVVEPFSARRDTLRLEFAPVAGAAAHELRISSNFSGYRRFVDSPIVVPGPMRDGGGAFVFPGGAARVTVAAVDANYYDYYRTTSDPIGGGVLVSRLHGGVGVFGSIVVIARRTLDVAR
jgi:hypothetical protein